MALRSAVLMLLRERRWDDVTIAAICRAAGISRSTFYQHFTDKNALVKSLFADFAARSAKPRVPASSRMPYPFLHAVLEHVHEQQDVFRALLGRRGSMAIRDAFLDLLVSLFAGVDPVPGDAAAEIRSRMLAGSFLELAGWWVTDGRALSLEEVERLFVTHAPGYRR
jgi:AcrR family transcriptional regulator